jgi:hypothetical protein
MFFTIRKNFRPFPNYSTFSEYILKTNNKFYNSIKKDCENYIFKKRMHELISADIISNTNNDNNTSLMNYYNDYPYEFYIFSIATFSVGVYSFLYFYRFKK